MNLRLIAARVINQVTQGASLADVLNPALTSLQDARDRAFVQALCYGVCRFYSRLDVVLSHLLKKPMREQDSDVHALVLVGLFQLMEMRTAPHAALAETVAAVNSLKKNWARGFVNAVLREYLRQHAQLSAIIAEDEEALYAHPSWWIKKIKQAWPAHWQAILEANNQHPPFSLRVNRQQIRRADYIKKLGEEIAKEIKETAMGIVLASPMAAESLPGFYAGEISVQDGAAQLAAELLQVKSDMRVLDACAAPGGKLTQLLEIEPQLTVLAVEKEPARMLVIKENLSRLKQQAICVTADAADTKAWWDGQRFDRILIDAPCSASGVIRRHPDIKLLREARDIPVLAKEQRHLLTSLWPLLKPDGLLLYATCSFFIEENVSVLRDFLGSHSDAEEDRIQADWGIEMEIGRQILPGMHEMDGFYYARLRKKSKMMGN